MPLTKLFTPAKLAMHNDHDGLEKNSMLILCMPGLSLQEGSRLVLVLEYAAGGDLLHHLRARCKRLLEADTAQTIIAPFTQVGVHVCVCGLCKGVSCNGY